jgi:hypothetical protein
MNIKQAKDLDLADFLAGLGFTPARKAKGELWYKSPFRAEDDTPSFKISTSGKAWFDFGDDATKGGNIIDFVLRYYQLPENDISGALRAIRQVSGRVVANDHKQPTQRPQERQKTAFEIGFEEDTAKTEKIEQAGYIINYVKEFEVWAGYGRSRSFSPLAQYLSNRGINPRIAAPFIVNIGFSPSKQPSKKWFGVGFKNNSGGFEVRCNFNGTNFKTCVGTKDFTFLEAKKIEGQPTPSRTLIFEGFVDFLSYLSMFTNVDVTKENYLILNGTTMTDRAIAAIKNHETLLEPLVLFTQTDEAGQRVSDKFLDLHDRQVLTAWHHYENFKDLNEALEAKVKASQPEPSIKPDFGYTPSTPSPKLG